MQKMKELLIFSFVQIRIVIDSGMRIVRGTETESKTGTGSQSKARPGLRLTSMDIKDEQNYSMYMLTEQQTLAIWASHPQERADNICRPG
ncbi:hypothetical protein EVAR_24931_1 [Eumeta japonica]|uniref:Uncharacterized protein n=1 Tax=Eumeta variegata TaxID=151549 RepID=A0A4C1V6I9_EUMVA|nr:hypothetical protein EVAR_24931_1 [Eumeta japonica]